MRRAVCYAAKTQERRSVLTETTDLRAKATPGTLSEDETVDLNNAIEMFPHEHHGGMMGYKRRQMFEASEVERRNAQVKDLNTRIWTKE